MWILRAREVIHTQEFWDIQTQAHKTLDQNHGVALLGPVPEFIGPWGSSGDPGHLAREAPIEENKSFQKFANNSGIHVWGALLLQHFDKVVQSHEYVLVPLEDGMAPYKSNAPDVNDFANLECPPVGPLWQALRMSKASCPETQRLITWLKMLCFFFAEDCPIAMSLSITHLFKGQVPVGRAIKIGAIRSNSICVYLKGFDYSLQRRKMESLFQARHSVTGLPRAVSDGVNSIQRQGVCQPPSDNVVDFWVYPSTGLCTDVRSPLPLEFLSTKLWVNTLYIEEFPSDDSLVGLENLEKSFLFLIF
ncbi:hypothetical protein Tco_1210439 [Tanacetum coccineum]